MDILGKNQDRRTIPRWRSFSLTSDLGELRHHESRRNGQPAPDLNYLRVLADWEGEKSIANASELLSYGFVINRLDEAGEAAEFLISQSSDISEAVSRLAEMVQAGRGEISSDANDEQGRVGLALPHQIEIELHALKARVRQWPRHPVLWADMSRLYTILGQDPQALRSMRIALNLARNNRFIMRAGARLAIHTHDPEYALNILQANDAFKFDPWLLAAEVSVNCILSRTSKYIKQARSIVDAKRYGYEHLSELASALGTVEMRYGSSKRARKYFATSLISPTENSLAQAEWASLRLSSIDTTGKLNIPGSYEANARHAVRTSNWDLVLQNCLKWAWDEPFSSSPCSAGSFFATSIFEDYGLALKFCAQGLRANPEDNDIINNKTVCLAQMGKLDEAKTTFLKLHDIDEKSNLAISTLATAGLIHYRSGDIAGGRSNYQSAIALAERLKREEMAAVYLTKEELRAGGEQVQQFYNQAKALVESSNDTIVRQMGSNIREYRKQKPSGFLNRLAAGKALVDKRG